MIPIPQSTIWTCTQIEAGQGRSFTAAVAAAGTRRREHSYELHKCNDDVRAVCGHMFGGSAVVLQNAAARATLTCLAKPFGREDVQI
jgi:hypothetical protein